MMMKVKSVEEFEKFSRLLGRLLKKWTKKRRKNRVQWWWTVKVIKKKKKFYTDESKKSWRVQKSLKAFGEIVEKVCQVYFQLKSLSKSILNKNPSKSVDFWIPMDILKVGTNLNWIPTDCVALKKKSYLSWLNTTRFI